MKRDVCIGVLVGMVVGNVAAVAHANIIAPTLLPSVLPLSVNWLLAIPATVLVAVLERPFVRRAGVTEAALRHCLWANAISTAVGFLVSPLAMWFVFSLLAPIWLVAVVAGSVLIEGLYYQRLAQVQANGLRWAWITAGNVVSSILLLAMTPISHLLEGRYRHLARLVERHEPAVLLALSLAVAIVLWMAFAGGLPRLRSRGEEQTRDLVGERGKEHHAAPSVALRAREQRTDDQVSPVR
jgi:hypothetical protein